MAGQSVRRISKTTATILLTVGLTVLFLAGINLVHREIALSFKRQRVADLALSALTRAEIATDYAVIRLGLLHEEGDTDCSPQALDALRLAVFRSGSIKDILMAKGDTVCSVAKQSKVLRENHFHPVDGASARNKNIVLNPLRLEGSPALAVTWKFDDDTLATALVNTEALVFDILPANLRETGAIKLSLANGRTVGSYEGPAWEIGANTEMFAVASERYPLVVRIHIPVSLLQHLNMNRSLPIDAAVTMLAVLIAYLVARGIVPSSSAASRVRRALKRGEIVPYFQPAYDVRSGEITGFEVLARWPGESGAMASPAFFVPLIEANGWSDELLEAMITQAAQEMATVLEMAPDVKFAFNASPAQLAEPTFAPWLAQVLERAGLEARRVVIEITEREEIGDIDKARQCIEALRKTGIDVAIDDAGTGHNGLASVQRLGAAVLKIDKLFVDGIAQDPRAATLVQMLVDVAHEFGMKTVAEGVEDENQLAALKRLGVDEVQGFFLCRPLAGEMATRELARHRAVLAQGRMKLHRLPSGPSGAVQPVALSA
ncbi:MAG: hypothetical protein Kow0026_14780 [Oricola sp.]